MMWEQAPCDPYMEPLQRKVGATTQRHRMGEGNAVATRH